MHWYYSVFRSIYILLWYIINAKASSGMTVGRVSGLYNTSYIAPSKRSNLLSGLSPVDRVSPVTRLSSLDANALSGRDRALSDDAGRNLNVYYSLDGDRADITPRAMELFRDMMAPGASGPLVAPNHSGPDIITNYNLDLPSPFLDWETILNTPVNTYGFQNGGPAGSAAPNMTQPDIAAPDVAPPYGATPPGNMPPVSMPPATPSGSDPTFNKEIPDVGKGLADFEPITPKGECHTCESRRYVDRSDDPSVSFQTPTKVSPNMSGAAVASHEGEHVRNEQGKAMREDRTITKQTVTLTHDVCPECGRTYVSGGTTHTTSIKKSDDSPASEAEGVGSRE